VGRRTASPPDHARRFAPCQAGARAPDRCATPTRREDGLATERESPHGGSRRDHDRFGKTDRKLVLDTPRNLSSLRELIYLTRNGEANNRQSQGTALISLLASVRVRLPQTPNPSLVHIVNIAVADVANLDHSPPSPVSISATATRACSRAARRRTTSKRKLGPVTSTVPRSRRSAPRIGTDTLARPSSSSSTTTE
jgi:hypothetical protein